MKLLLLALALPLAAQDLPPVTGKPVLPDFAAEIEALLPAFANDDLDVREKASAALRKLTETYDEEPALRAALKARLGHSEPEVRARLGQALGAMPLFKVSFDVSLKANAYDEHPVWVVIKNISGEDQPYLEHWGNPVDYEARLNCWAESDLGTLSQYLLFYPTRDPVLLRRPEARTLTAGKELALKATISTRRFLSTKRVTLHAYAGWHAGGYLHEFVWEDGRVKELHGDLPPPSLPNLRVLEWKPKP